MFSPVRESTRTTTGLAGHKRSYRLTMSSEAAGVSFIALKKLCPRFDENGIVVNLQEKLDNGAYFL